MSASSVAAVLLFASGAAAAQTPDLARVERLIVERTNQFRVEHGLGLVKLDAALARAARYFADYMAQTDRYGHSADGKEASDRARSRGYDYCLVSENISYQLSSEGFQTAELAGGYVEGWKQSPGHRKNMLEPAAVDTAVAVARSARTGRYYAVQMFGRPRTASIKFMITNKLGERITYRVGDEELALASGAGRVHTECAPPELVVYRTREGDVSTVPADRDRFVVVRERNGFVLRRER